MPEDFAITLHNLSKRFDEGPSILEDLNLSIKSGEIISIIGASGCGKSTLLRLCAGLLKPTVGHIEKDIDAADQAFIFQDPALLPWATVEQNITLPHRLKQGNKASHSAIATEWAERLGLSHALQYYPKQLSGGMCMRVSIARALSLSPRLILMDEPFGALDAITRNRLNEDLLDLHKKENWTGLFVTHSVTEAVFLSHRIILLSNHSGIATQIDNPLPFRRNAATRESLAFQETVAHVTHQLQQTLNELNRQPTTDNR